MGRVYPDEGVRVRGIVVGMVNPNVAARISFLKLLFPSQLA